MTDLSALTAAELAEKVQSALPVSDLVSGEGVLALAELVRRASERDQAVRERDEAATCAEVYQKAARDFQQRADRLAAALEPFAESWDFHAADYLADLIDGEEMRLIPSSVVAEMIAAVAVARDALSASEETQT